MARQFLTSIDHGFEELKGLRIENRSNAPSDPQDGYIYFDTVNDNYRLYQNGAWFELAPGGVLVGLLSDRPAAIPAAQGQMFYAEDSEALYIDIGGQWIALEGHGHNPVDIPWAVSSGQAKFIEDASVIGTDTITISFAMNAQQVCASTRSGALTVAWSSIVSSIDMKSITLIVPASVTAITWPSGTRFPDGDPPDAPSGETWYELVSRNGTVTVFEIGRDIS